jgi:cell shape-determining protein MreC
MNLVTDILLAILIFAAIILCIYLMIFFRKSTSAIEKLQEDIHQIKIKIDPVLSNLNSISDNIVNVTDTIENQISAYAKLADEAKEKVEILLNIDKKIKENIANSPLAELYKKLTGVSKGISAFWETYTRK